MHFHVVVPIKAMRLSADILGAIVMAFGCLGAMIAMSDECNTICVHKSASLLVTSEASFIWLLLEQQCLQMINPCVPCFLTEEVQVICELPKEG